MKKELIIFFSTFTVVLTFILMQFLPLVSRFESDEIEVESNTSDDIVSVGDPPSNSSPAYHYWYAPENSMGVKETKTVNWTYFKALFQEHFYKKALYKRYSYSDWTDGTQYLTLNKTWNESGFWKVDIILDIPVDLYSVNVSFGCDLQVLNYIERDGYEIWLNYTANASGEIYQIKFNWSDIASIPNLEISKHRTDGKFWISFKRDNVPAGYYVFDPMFGQAVTGATNYAIYWDYSTNYVYMRGTAGAPESDGTADSITINLHTVDTELGFQCALYDYDAEGDAGELLGVTEIKDISSTGEHTFNFSDPKSSVTDGVTYYVAVRPTDVAGNYDARIYQSDPAPGTGFAKWSTTTLSFDDPLTGETDSNECYVIYCSYTLIPGRYYFNAYSVSEKWQANPAYMVDGSILTASQPSGTGDIELCNGNTCDGTDLGTINTVKIRAYGNWGSSSGDAELQPAFSGGVGTYVNCNWGSSPGWSNWINITGDTNAPSPWTWSAVDGLDCRVKATVGGLGTLDCMKVEIQVNFTEDEGTTWHEVQTGINGSWTNTTTWREEQTGINGSWTNLTAFHEVQTIINGSWTNTTTYHEVQNTINGSWINITTYHDAQTGINGSWVNLTLFKEVQTDINGSWTNTTTYHETQTGINGSWINTSLLSWYETQTGINGTWINLTIFQEVQTTINGTWTNLTAFKEVQTTVNGSWINTTTYHEAQTGINGSWTNLTVFQEVQIGINGSWINTTVLSWHEVQTGINGSWTNTTTYHETQTGINGSWINTTIWHETQTGINGSWTNLTVFQEVQTTINGSWTNITTYHEVQTGINGTWTNTTTLNWYETQTGINGSWINTTIFQETQTGINGSWTNTTTYHETQTTINGSWVNSSILNWYETQTGINGSWINTSLLSWYETQTGVNGSWTNTTAITPGVPGGGSGGGYLLITVSLFDVLNNPIGIHPVLLYRDDLLVDKRLTNFHGITEFLVLPGRYSIKTTYENTTKMIAFEVDPKSENSYEISFAQPTGAWIKLNYIEFFLIVFFIILIIALTFYRRKWVNKGLKKFRDKHIIKLKRR